MATCMAGGRPAMAGGRPAMAGGRPGGHWGTGGGLMSPGPVWALARILPAPATATIGGRRGDEGVRYRSSRWRAAIRCGGIVVTVPPFLRFQGQRPHWWDATKRKAPASVMRPNTDSSCPQKAQTHDQHGEANAPHPGRVGRADLPSLDSVVRDERDRT